jgi:hypothetical protein
MTFHDTIIDQSKYVCEQLSKIDEIAYFDFNIRISGTTNGEGVDIEYSIGDSRYSSVRVEGNSIKAVVEEFMRRHGWKAMNSVKAISFYNAENSGNRNE